MAYSKLLTALAESFPTRDAAVNFLQEAELPYLGLVSGQFGAPLDEWQTILRKLVNRESGGLAKLCAAAAAAMPGADAFVLSHQDLEQIRERCREPELQDGPSPLYGVPDAMAVDFIGRAATMGQLQELLLKAGSVRVAPSLEGLAGIGKTELALQLVYQLAGQGAFPGGIFWFDAENPDLAPVWGSQIADRLEIPTAPISERAVYALNRVSQSGRTTLIVLDNVETWGGEASPGPLPEGSHLRYLLTTRSRNLGGRLFQHFPIGFLKPPYDRDLLISAAAGRDLPDDGSVETLLKHLGGHALALELAGAFLGEFPDQTPASYLEAIQAGEPVDERASDLVRYQRTVSQAFSTIWERIDLETRDAWRLASCFAPEMVSPELSESVGLSSDVLHGLRRLHLVEMGGSGGWRMHRLIQEFGRCAGTAEKLGEARRRFVVGCAEYIAGIEFADGFRVYLPVRSHLDRALSQAEEALEVGDSRWPKFLNDISVGLYSTGDPFGARELLKQALESDIRNLGENHPKVATRRSILATVLRALGELSEARELLEQALESDIKNFGENHPSVATRCSSLAEVLQDLGKLLEARELLVKALESNKNHSGVATSLAGVLKDLGELSGARELLVKALEFDIQNLGENHPSVATRRSNLAAVLRSLDLWGARELLEKALESDIKNLGENHPRIATRRSELAMVLKDLGELWGARELLEKALESDIGNLGENHPSVATRRSELAMVLKDLGELSEAKELLEKALESDIKNLGENHTHVAIRRVNLAKALHTLGEQGHAVQEAGEAARIISLMPEGSLVRFQIEHLAAQILGEA